MKYLSIVFVAAITLVSCGGGMETACDCVNGLAALDMEDSAAVAEFVEANEAVCEPLMEDTAADFSECAEAAAEFGYGAEESAEVVEEVVEEAVEVVEEVVDSAVAVVDSAVAEEVAE